MRVTLGAWWVACDACLPLPLYHIAPAQLLAFTVFVVFEALVIGLGIYLRENQMLNMAIAYAPALLLLGYRIVQYTGCSARLSMVPNPLSVRRLRLSWRATFPPTLPTTPTASVPMLPTPPTVANNVDAGPTLPTTGGGPSPPRATCRW